MWTFHTWVEYVSLLLTYYEHLYIPMENTPNSIRLERPGLPCNSQMPQESPLPTPNGSSITSCTFAQQHHKVPISYNGTPHILPRNCSFQWGYLYPCLLASSLDLANPLLQMASKSNQPFCYNPPDRPTDCPTDWQSRWQNLYQYALTLYWWYSDVAKNETKIWIHTKN